MAENIRSRDDFREALRQSVPDLIRESPQLFIDALTGDRALFADSLKKSGFILGKNVEPKPEDILEARERAVADGRVFAGYGAAQMRSMRHLARDVRGLDGKVYTSFVSDPELNRECESWFRALFNKGTDPQSKKQIWEIYEGIEKGVRAPSTPLLPDVGTTGGNLVPSPIVAQLFVEFNERFVLGAMVQVYTSAAPLRFLRRIAQVTLSRSNLATDIGETDFNGTIGTMTLSPNRVAAVTYVDPRLAQAAVLGPVQYVISQFAEAYAKDTQRVIVAGAKALNEPEGLNTLPTSGGNAYDRAQTFPWTDTDNKSKRNSIRGAWYKVNQVSRESAKFIWVTNNDGMSKFASLNDLDQQPFKDPTAGSPATLFGKQVVESSAIVTSGGNTQIVGADMGQYAWVEAPGGMRMEQTTEGGASWLSDTIGIKLVTHVDGGMIIPPAAVIVNTVPVP